MKLELSFVLGRFEDAKNFSALDCLQSCPLLTELKVEVSGSQMHSTKINPNGLEMVPLLFSYLEPLLLNKLKVLRLCCFVFNSSAAEVMSRSLQSQHCSLITLNFNNCSFLGDVFKQLAIAIGRNTSLHSIIFYLCPLDSADGKVLADALRKNKTLKEVNILRQHRDPYFDAKVVFQTLKQCNQSIAFHVH